MSERRILVENARRRSRLRYGGARKRLDFEQVDLAAPMDDERLQALSDALDRLCEEDSLVADIVKLRYFAGLTIEQTAESTQVSVRTANRHWVYAKAWLFEDLR